MGWGVGRIVFALCALACAVAHVAILRSVLRTATTRPTESGVPRPGLVAEIMWAVLPMLALALVLTATWVKVDRRDVPRPEPVLEIAR